MKKPTKISKKLKKPKLPAVPARLKRARKPEEKVSEALSNVPRITSDTVEEHREAVLSSARKYIYPLQHSKHSVVRTSISIFIAVVIIFLAYCGLALYKLQSTNGFIYGVTKVVPFPVAKVGSHWVKYESYLFELRRSMHYYRTQQRANFSTPDGKAQLARLKQQAMDETLQNAYVNQLAGDHGVTVNNQQVNQEVSLLRNENRLGSDLAYRTALSQYYGWSDADFRRELHQELLQQAVVAKLDTATNQRAQAALTQLANGTDFAKLAGQVSDDAATKGNGGQYPAAITANDPSVPPVLVAELFKLKPGQTSGIINTGYTLEIAKVIDNNNGVLHAAHIQFTFKPISNYTKSLQAKEPPHEYIKV